MLGDDVVAVIELAFDCPSTGKTLEGPVYVGPDEESARQHERLSQILCYLMPHDLRQQFPEILIWTIRNGGHEWVEDILCFFAVPLAKDIEQRQNNLQRDREQRDYAPGPGNKRHRDLEQREQALHRDSESRNCALANFADYTIAQKAAIVQWLEWVRTVYGDAYFIPFVPALAFWTELLETATTDSLTKPTGKKKRSHL